MTEILTEQIDTEDQYRVVRLSSKYTQYGFREMHARMDSNTGTQFTFIRSDHKPKHFDLSIEEVNVLVAAWLKFEDDVEAVKAAEEERQARVLAEAMQLANEHNFDFNGLQVAVSKSNDSTHYDVRVPAIGFHYDRYITTPDFLLEAVREAVDAIDRHIIWLEEKVLPSRNEGDNDSITVHNRKMVAAYRAVKPKSPASSDIAPEAESEEAMF